MGNGQIGILGGGQLGWMLAMAAERLGLRLTVLDPDPNAPAGRVANQHLVGRFDAAEQIMALAGQCSLITCEIEHVNTEALEAVAGQVEIAPAPAVVRLLQDKLAQKTFLKGQGLPVAPFMATPTLESAYAAGQAFGYPFLLKARRLAYDGRGNAVVASEAALPEAWQSLGGDGAALYAEQYIPFSSEAALMAARNRDGAVALYPLVQTIHQENICHLVIAPHPQQGQLEPAAQKLASAAVTAMAGVGIFGIELFVLADGSLLINEIAPRPHNSGHYSLEACHTNQFEQHLRAICGLPLGDTALKVGAAIMINWLGLATQAETEAQWQAALALPKARLYHYGKQYRPQRKLGHFTLTGNTLAEVWAAAAPLLADSAIRIAPAAEVAIIMGSDSDLPTMQDAAKVLADFGIAYQLNIVSAHRTPEYMMAYAKSAAEKGIKVIIAGAGGAAHLPGMVAALTPLPVIGVPVQNGPLAGLDALYSIVQMPRGVPVATVAIGNAVNAGLLAVRILAANNAALLAKMRAYQQDLNTMVLAKAAQLEG
jgi:phosphoribosylaminoimidazole carboxylase